QDWHPADHQSFASQHPGRKVGDLFDLNGLPQTAWPDHCVQGSAGAELVAELDQSKITSIVRKGINRNIDSYSGFFDNGHQQSTGLTDLLRQRDVETIYLMGLATDYCVRLTALDAVTEGFQVFLITDGCRGVNLTAGDVDRAIHQMKDAGVRLLTSSELKDSLPRQPGAQANEQR
ncbi:MAG: bifunctional nicotinamidase/pyrazinamidase, partial [Planctomycetaceae bacterium]|nr:bifunctional nicotinamidase/pyrazinamidase [Planctomycetaceae bacterium]